MMNKKYYLLTAIMLLATGLNLFANQITRVGVIDRAKILQTFYAESQGMRDLEAMKEEIQAELVRLNDEIKLYEERKLAAENRGDESEALRMDDIIFNKRQYMSDYYRTKNNQLTERQKRLTQNTDFARELMDIIGFVALSQGCSIVLDMSTPGLIWSNEEVDITNMVLERLQSLN